MSLLPGRALLLLLALVPLGAAAAEPIAVAAAANLSYVLAPLNAAFTQANPGVNVTSTIGASGSLVAQISRGAPYDVFLSADLDFPRKLQQAGGAAAGATVVTFAYGRLVLWTTREALPLGSVESVLRSRAVHRVAEANPRTAPYGRAAEEVLAHLGLAEEVRPKIVVGENISQAAQYVASGNADVGFVALSLVSAPSRPSRGRWLEVPSSLYAPIAEGAILTKYGGGHRGAQRYLEFLTGAPARRIFAQFGYGLPPAP
jgi:molybdate transport system substrate-binding protein